ncbi:hypothetical protein D3C72_2427460 [compost metagenome]
MLGPDLFPDLFRTGLSPPHVHLPLLRIRLPGGKRKDKSGAFRPRLGQVYAPILLVGQAADQGQPQSRAACLP